MGLSPAGPESVILGTLGLWVFDLPRNSVQELHGALLLTCSLLDTKAMLLLLPGHLSGPLRCCLPMARWESVLATAMCLSWKG